MSKTKKREKRVESMCKGPQRFKDLVLPQMRHRLRLQLGFDPWLGDPYAAVQKKKEKKRKKERKVCAQNVIVFDVGI